MLNLCTAIDVKNLIQQSAGYNGHNALIAQMVQAASAQVRNFTKRQFDKRQRSEVFLTPDASGFSVSLPETPIDMAQPFTVTYDRTGQHGATAEVLSLNIDYEVDAESGRITLFGQYLYAPRGLKVVYTGGYDVHPSDATALQTSANVAQATALQAAFMLRRVLAQSLGHSSEMKEGTSMTSYGKEAQSGLIPEAISMLGASRRVMVGRL